MELRGMVKNWLIENGYTGLVNTDVPCGCELEDLIPCGSPTPECAGGYKHKCDTCTKVGVCEIRGEGGEWCIRLKEG